MSFYDKSASAVTMPLLRFKQGHSQPLLRIRAPRLNFAFTTAFTRLLRESRREASFYEAFSFTRLLRKKRSYCSRPFSGPCENSDVVRVLPLPQSVRCRCMFAGVAQLLPVLPAAGLPGHTLLHTFTDDPAACALLYFYLLWTYLA